MSDIKKVYVDVNVFLNSILYDPEEIPEAQKARDFLVEMSKGNILCFTSVLSWDELVWVIRKSISIDFARQKGEEFLTLSKLVLLPVSKEIVHKAQEFIGKYALKPRDSIHLASAILNQISEIITFDEDFSGVDLITAHPP